MESDRAELTGKKVVIGLTGRMDSAMAAFLLKKQGMEVIGLSIVTAADDIASNKDFRPVCHVENLDRVKELCDRIGAPFYATNAKPQFESDVIDRLVCNKLLGKANSSCFNCSRFRMEVLHRKMLELGADFIATGHYAKVHKNLSSNEYFIHSNNDEKSDQSFLLAGAPSNVLEKLLLPLGDLSKEEVKKYIKHFGLPAEPSTEQEGFCFRSKEASKAITEKRVPKSMIRSGQVENLENGNTLGEHKGVIYHYLTEKDLEFKGTVHVDKSLEVVGYNYPKAALLVGAPERLSFKGAQLTRLSLSEGVDRSSPVSCFVKFKYSKNFVKAEMFYKNNDSAFLQFDQKIYPLISSEVLVIYESDSVNSKILGWGTIGTRGDFRLVNRVEAFERQRDGQEGEQEKSSKYFKF